MKNRSGDRHVETSKAKDPPKIVSLPKAVTNVSEQFERHQQRMRPVAPISQGAANQVDWKTTVLIVFSESLDEARQCVSKNGVPNNRWVFLRDPTILLAQRTKMIVWRYGKYYKRPDMLKIEQIIEAVKVPYMEAP